MSFAAQVETNAGESPIASSLYGVCTTAAATAAKTVTMEAFDALVEGTTIHIKFQNTNTAVNPTLAIGSTAALPIYRYGTTPPGTTEITSWKANTVLSLTYDGTAWRMNDSSLAVWEAVWQAIYPVGAIYMSVNSTSPATLFGGTWERIQDKFILSAGSSYAAGSTGGAATVTLTTSNMPSHNHSIPALSGTAASNGGHTHTPNTHIGFLAYNYEVNRTRVAGGSGNGFAPLGGQQTDIGFATATSSSGSHTHSVTTTANTSGSNGSGTAHNNMPPYLAVYVWKRTA